MEKKRKDPGKEGYCRYWESIKTGNNLVPRVSLLSIACSGRGEGKKTDPRGVGGLELTSSTKFDLV